MKTSRYPETRDSSIIVRDLKSRTIHLVDLENMAGCSELTEAAVRRVRAVYLASNLVESNDHVVIATSHHNLLATGCIWTDARLVVRSGRDGADLALQEIMATERLEQRFGACILASGDGGFASSTAALIGRGLPVGVIAPQGALSAALKLAATASREIDFNLGAQSFRSA